MKWIRAILFSTLLVFLLVVAGGDFASAKTKKKGFVPKTGKEERQALLFAHVQKRFIITRDTDIEQLAQIGQIENATFVLDGKGKFPPKSMLVNLSGIGKPVELILPLQFTSGHLRRLEALETYTAVFPVKAGELDEKAVNRVLGLGPKRKVFVLTPDQLTAEVIDLLEKVRQFDLRLEIPAGETLSNECIKLLRRKSLSGMKEIVVPDSYPPAMLAKLKNLTPMKVLIQVRGAAPEASLVVAVNKLKKVEGGFSLRGLIKPDEAFNYMFMTNLSLISMSIEDWKISDHFIRMMNSRGEMETQR